ncbi:MAG: STAS domain-containing protein [Draconibacterium sp.]|nr:STAS domain-containing protein [Draconibacterium sp.]
MKVPILRLKKILLTSIQVELTDEDAIEFQSDVLSEVTRTEAKGIIIDITALDIVDSYMARVLNDTANMVQFLGCEVIITGMQPSVAITLIEMGRKLVNVGTALNLDRGMEKIQRMISSREEGTPAVDEGE